MYNNRNMTVKELKKLVQDIVASSKCLSETFTTEKNVPVNYVCVFTHTDEEFTDLIDCSKEMGEIAHETATGPIFLISPISTVAGTLRILKIRKPDPKRPERGDADFTLPDYPSFKEKYSGQIGFNVIVRPEMEMMELLNPCYNVLVYYSYPTLAEVLKIKID